MNRPSTTARSIATMLRSLAFDDGGQDLIEYALLSGAVGAAGALLIPSIVTGMQSAYVNWQTNVRSVWQPCGPGASPC